MMPATDRVRETDSLIVEQYTRVVKGVTMPLGSGTVDGLIEQTGFRVTSLTEDLK